MFEIRERVNELRRRYDRRVGERDALKRRFAKLSEQREEADKFMLVAREATLLLEHASKDARQLVTKRFNDIVTYALQSVFGEDYRFEATLEVKRNTVWAEFKVLSDSYSEAADPLLSRGGGVVDIVSLALRIVLLELYAPRIDGPLLLDEPTKQLSKEFSGAASELLRAISERTGRQIILVTHDSILAKEADERFEI